MFIFYCTSYFSVLYWVQQICLSQEAIAWQSVTASNVPATSEGMTQKELGIAIGFEEKSADIRIAQYESNTRTPKEELLRKIAEVLDVNYRSLYEPTLYAAEDVMYTLFELDEHYPGTRLYEVIDTTDPDFPEKHMAVSFRYRLLDDFLKEWQLRKKQLRKGEITKEEYLEWKLNWPQTADGCGRYEPKKKWRKE